MKRREFGAALCLAAMLAGCGGGSGGSASSGGGGTSVTPPPPPPPSGTTGCTLRERQDWAAAQLKEWYLFPETLPSSLDPTPYSTLGAYVDALTATARAQHRDRFFTYVTSIAEENAFFSSGSSAGFGIRLSYDESARRLFVTEAFEGAPALAAGIDRGTEITGIGTSTADIKNVSDLFASGGAQAVSDAIGPSTAGLTRVLRIVDTSGATKTLTVAKADYTLTPLSSRYGSKIIDNGGQKVGYVNLRTFIDTADPALRSAFANFRANGVTQVIVDLRYNGGGLVSIAELFGDLLGGNRSTSDVFDYQTFRPEKSSFNTQHNFAPKSQSVSSVRLAFIGTSGTASASELVINAFTPFLHSASALVGTNTYGKPVGQIAIDRTACDDRFRIIAFATQNGAHQGEYFDGLAPKMEATCQAADDFAHPLGDPSEASVRTALDFLGGRSCTKIAAAAPAGAAAGAPQRPKQLLIPDKPTAPQHEVPGLF